MVKPHIRLYTKRPNGGAWFAVVKYKDSPISRSFGMFSALPALLAVIALSACAQPLTNDQIIAEYNKCKAAGMDTILLTSEANETARVECHPRKLGIIWDK